MEIKNISDEEKAKAALKLMLLSLFPIFAIKLVQNKTKATFLIIANIIQILVLFFLGHKLWVFSAMFMLVYLYSINIYSLKSYNK